MDDPPSLRFLLSILLHTPASSNLFPISTTYSTGRTTSPHVEGDAHRRPLGFCALIVLIQAMAANTCTDAAMPVANRWPDGSKALPCPAH